MATQETDFKELLSRAPAVRDADTVTVVGAIARSSDATKFVLVTADGQTFTLDVAAVKKHNVIADSIGHLVVELDLDATKIPAEARKTVATIANPGFKGPLEGNTGVKDLLTTAETAAEVIHYPGSLPLWADYGPGFGNPAYGYASPFVVVTAHQAPEETMATMQRADLLSRSTRYIWDVSPTGLADIKPIPKDPPLDRWV
jgi:hypothetical protein